MIAVIVPVHNAENTIDRCVTSLLGQEFSDVKVILVENGSTDESYKKCLKWVSIDKRVVVLQSDKGISKARNKGLDWARANNAEYVAFADSDDTVCPEIYAELYEKAEKENADIVFCSYYVMSENGKAIVSENMEPIVNSKKLFPFFYGKGKVGGAVWRILFSEKVYRQLSFNENVHIAEDLLFTVGAVKTAQKISYINKPLYNYYAPSGNIYNKHVDNRYLDTALHIVQTLEEIFNEEEKKTLLPIYKFSLYDSIIRTAIRGHRRDYKRRIKPLLQDEFCSEIRKKENYKAYMKTGSLSDRISAWLSYHKVFWLLNLIVNR